MLYPELNSKALFAVAVPLTSTTSSAETTPTAPPQNEATIGSTSASCAGRCMLWMNSGYEEPAGPTTTHGNIALLLNHN